MKPTMQSSRSGVSPVHLTDDQFAECLMGADFGSGINAHLSTCQDCREELDHFGTSVNTFNTAAMRWSESRSGSLLGSRQTHNRWTLLTHRPFFAPASWALASCLMLAAGVSITHHHDVETVASLTQVQDDSEAQIAQDNKLLTEVDRATRNYDRSPAQEYGLGPYDESEERRHIESRTQ